MRIPNRFGHGDQRMNKRIAVFTNGFSNEFVEHVVTGLQKKAAEDGVDIFVFVTYCAAGDNELQNKCQLNIFHLPDPEGFDGAVMLTNTYNFPNSVRITVVVPSLNFSKPMTNNIRRGSADTARTWTFSTNSVTARDSL